MSIFGAMNASISGLSAQANALGIISDNIANSNTIGYKGTITQFSTLVTQNATQNAYSPGGVRSAPVAINEAQGLLQSSSNRTDIAIAGNGFFVVNEDSNPGLGDEMLFTRAGHFAPDENGDLVNASGYYLQGYQLDSTGAIIGNPTVLSSLRTVNIAGLTGAANATTTLDLSLNLPSTDAVGATRSMTAQVFDSLGNAHDITYTFTKTAANAWDVTVANPTLSSTGAASGTVTGPVARSITFNGDGSPNVITFPPVAVTWTTGADPSSIAVGVGTAAGFDGVTQLAGDFAVGPYAQDGQRFGQFSGIAIDEDGIVTALFDNGTQRQIYQIPLAQFANPRGLEARNGNAFAVTDDSGEVILNAPNTGSAGVIAAEALEASTVDIAQEFTRMIVTQRAYSANASVLTTADEMLEEIIRVGR